MSDEQARFQQDLLDAADDLDMLEELDPRPGRVGLGNRLRRRAIIDLEAGAEVLKDAMRRPWPMDLTEHVQAIVDAALGEQR
jgi:hypothetical protein